MSNHKRLESRSRSSLPRKYKPYNPSWSYKESSRHSHKTSNTNPIVYDVYHTVSKGSSSLGQVQLKVFDTENAKVDPIRIDLYEIRQAIDQLSLNQRLTISEMQHNEKLKQAYDTLQRGASSLYETEYYEKSIINYLKTKPVYTVKPGTIGQFLFGNTRNDYGNTTAECSPVGIGALPSTNNKRSCARQVWYFQGSHYEMLTKKSNSSLADIYIPINFKGLNETDMKKLAKHNVEEVTLYTLIPNNEDFIAVKRTESIPLRETAINSYAKHLLPITNYDISKLDQLITNGDQSNVSSQMSNLSTTSVNAITKQEVNSESTETNNYPQTSSEGKSNKEINKYNHVWVWIVLVFIFIIIVAWIGYNINKERSSNLELSYDLT